MSATPESVAAAAGGAAASAAAGASASAPWYGADAPDDVKTFVTGKGWDNPMKAITSYRELEAFRGVPAERLLKLPEKPDAPEWADIRAKVGWKAPEKPEDYGIAVPEGHSPEYAQSIAAIAHQRGIPKDDMLALVDASNKYAQAAQAQQDQTIRSRLTAADEALKQSLGPKHAETMELVQREMSRLGLAPSMVEAVESTLASQDEKGVGAFRQLLVDLAVARKEGPLHTGATAMGQSTAAEAQTKLAELSTNAEWVAKATSRGTPEAKERLRLNMRAAGVTPNEEEVTRLANAVYGTV